MKNFAESSQIALENTQNSLMRQDSQRNTLRLGSISDAGKTSSIALARQARPGQVNTNLVIAALSARSTHSLWLIKPTSPQSQRETAINILNELLTPVNYEESVYWLGRFVQHFPNKDPEQNAIVVADLSADCVNSRVSVCGLVEALTELRHESQDDNPFRPPSGEVLKRAIGKTNIWKRQLERLMAPDVPQLAAGATAVRREPDPEKPPLPWENKAWGELDKAEKLALREHLLGMTPEKAEQYRKWKGFPAFSSDAWTEIGIAGDQNGSAPDEVKAEEGGVVTSETQTASGGQN